MHTADSSDSFFPKNLCCINEQRHNNFLLLLYSYFITKSKIKIMITAKAYAAQSPETDLAPWSFERREVGEHDVQFDIMYCGVCHSDLHQIKNDWFPGIFPMVPGHEIVGKVAKVGSHVKKHKVGDIVG